MNFKIKRKKREKITKNPIIKFAFYLLIIFSLYSIFNIIKSYPLHFKIKGFDYPVEQITINMEFNQRTNKDFLFCFNDFCSGAQKDDFSNLYTIKFNEETQEFFNSKIKNIYLIYPYNDNNFEKNIKVIDLHCGTKSLYFENKDIQKFKKTAFKVELNDTTKKYNAIKIPFNTNYKGVFNHCCILFLSLFYNASFFIIPYFWLFIAFLLYFFNKNEFNLKFKITHKTKIFILISIIFLGFLLRLNGITYYPLWLDEIYTKTTAITSLKSCFQDPGNPPLFYILEYVITKILNDSTISLRLISLVSGIFFPFGIYLIFKKINIKSAIFMAFFASINTINIYHSQEARVYGLSMCAGVFSIYFLFKYLEKQNAKNLIIYTLNLIFLINLHYYNLFLGLFNVIWGLFNIKNKKERFKYLFANCLSFITFLPYLVYSFKFSTSQQFNSWIKPLDLNTFNYILKEYFSNKYIFILFITIIIIYLSAIIIHKFYKKINLNHKKTELFLYLIFSILFIIITTSLVSLLVKPILHKRLLLSCYELLLLLEGILILGIFNVKKYIHAQISAKIILMFIFIYMTKPMPLRQIYVLDDFMNFVEKDSIQYKNKYEIHCVTNDTQKYINNYKNLKSNKYIIWHYVNSNSMEYIKKISKKDFIKNNKKGIIYLHDMSADIDKIGFLNPNARIYHTNSIRNLKLIYE